MLDDKYILKKQVSNDIAQNYNNKISTIIDEIDDLKKSLINDKKIIVYLSERIHALFIKLAPKFSPEQIKKQREYNKELRKIKLFNTKKVQTPSGDIIALKSIRKDTLNSLFYSIQHQQRAIIIMRITKILQNKK